MVLGGTVKVHCCPCRVRAGHLGTSLRLGPTETVLLGSTDCGTPSPSSLPPSHYPGSLFMVLITTQNYVIYLPATTFLPKEGGAPWGQ